MSAVQIVVARYENNESILEWGHCKSHPPSKAQDTFFLMDSIGLILSFTKKCASSENGKIAHKLGVEKNV